VFALQLFQIHIYTKKYPTSIISSNSLNLPLRYILGLIQQLDNLTEQCFSPSLEELQHGRQELGSILAPGPGMAGTRRPPAHQEPPADAGPAWAALLLNCFYTLFLHEFCPKTWH